MIATAVNAPDQLIARVLEMAILFALYGTIAHGVQRFRTFQVVAGVLAVTCMFITAVCLHQGLSPTQCIGGIEEAEGAIEGEPDGRSCETSECSAAAPDAEPGLEYRCEHVGLFGTYSVDDRVRYRGELHDPERGRADDLRRRHGDADRVRAAQARVARWQPGCVGVAVIVVVATVWMTQSRGGLVAALLVPGVYVVRRYGVARIVPAAMVALPVLILGGRSGENAEMSTADALRGVGHRPRHVAPQPDLRRRRAQFAEHHFLTAHNSFVLTLAELGIVGMFLFIAIIYLCVKTLIVGVRELRDVPGTAAAQVWGMALLAAMTGHRVPDQHAVVRVPLGAVAVLRPGRRVVLGGPPPPARARDEAHGRDLVIIAVTCLAYATVILPVFLKAKGEL